MKPQNNSDDQKIVNYSFLVCISLLKLKSTSTKIRKALHNPGVGQDIISIVKQ